MKHRWFLQSLISDWNSGRLDVELVDVGLGLLVDRVDQSLLDEFEAVLGCTPALTVTVPVIYTQRKASPPPPLWLSVAERFEIPLFHPSVSDGTISI